MTFEEFETEFGFLGGVNPVLSFNEEQLELLADYIRKHIAEAVEKYTAEDMDAAYQEGYDDCVLDSEGGYDNAYQEGYDDGYEEGLSEGQQ